MPALSLLSELRVAISLDELSRDLLVVASSANSS